MEVSRITEKDDDKTAGLLGNVPKENLDELRLLADDCLQKAGLTELSEKLGALNAGK